MLGAPLEALAEPRWVRISIVGDAATSMGVAWNTLDGPAEARVDYGTRSGRYEFQAQAVVGPRVSETLGRVSEAVLLGLQPETTYFYRVGGPRGGLSREHVFRTAPAGHLLCGRFSFAYAGDSRAEAWDAANGGSVKWPLFALSAASRGPALMLHGGDLVYDGRKPPQWVNYLEVTSLLSASLPIMYSIGNHDDGPGQGDGANYNRLFQLPRSSRALGGTGTEDFYTFTYANTRFVALSSETFMGGRHRFGRQAAWLDKVLARSRQRWTVVYLHKPIYTDAGVFGHPPDEAGQNAALVPVFNRHAVDLVIGSHNHFYERFAPSNCRDGSSKAPCPTVGRARGTVYVTSGGGGAFPIFYAGGTDRQRVAASGAHHYLYADVTATTLTVEAVDDRGSRIDRFTLLKPLTTSNPCKRGPGSAKARNEGPAR